MIHLTADTQILLSTQPADFRRGIDGFAALCRGHLSQDPRGGILFMFINRDKTMVRGFCHDGTGFWLMTKRLSKGRFKGWPSPGEKCSPATAKQLRALLYTGNADWRKA